MEVLLLDIRFHKYFLNAPQDWACDEAGACMIPLDLGSPLFPRNWISIFIPVIDEVFSVFSVLQVLHFYNASKCVCLMIKIIMATW